jgi:hypothetical protein
LNQPSAEKITFLLLSVYVSVCPWQMDLSHFSFKIGSNIIDGIEVLGDQFFIIHLNRKGFLQESDQFQDTCGVNDAFFQERGVVFQAVGGAEEEISDDEGFDFGFCFTHFELFSP